MSGRGRIVLAVVILTVGGAALIGSRLGLPDIHRRTLFYLGGAEGCTLQQALHPINERVLPAYEQTMDTMEAIETIDGLTRWRTPQGDWWAPDPSGLAYVMAEQSLDTYQLAEEGLGSESVVIDAGANVGLFTRAAVSAGVGLVVSIDPSPINARALRRNFADEIVEGRVIVVEKGLWHEPGLLPMYVYENSALDSLVMDERVETENKPRKVEVPLDTLDAIVEDLGLEQVDFIKMDIEGAERNAIRGAQNTIRRHRPTMTIATENLPDDVTAVPEAVAAIVPEYEVRSGDCRIIDRFHVRPEALHLRLPQ